MITTREIYHDGVLVSTEQVEIPDPEPVPVDSLIASVDQMTPEQKADLRAALGL